MRRLIAYLNKTEEMGLSLILLLLALMGSIQVVLRYVFEISFDWFEELGRYLGVLITFLGASLGVKYGVHFSMDLVMSSLKPPWKNLLSGFVNLASASAFLVVAYFGFRLVVRNYQFETTSSAMQLPMYWAYLPIPVFSFISAVRFLIKLRRDFLGQSVAEKEAAISDEGAPEPQGEAAK